MRRFRLNCAVAIVLRRHRRLFVRKADLVPFGELHPKRITRIRGRHTTLAAERHRWCEPV